MISFDLTGRVAMVVGARTGIGRGIALGLAESGADVVVAGRGEEMLKELATEIRASGRRALPCVTDITRLKDIEALTQAAVAEFGRIDILVNNAGVNIHESALEVTEEHWDRIIDTNLKGTFFCCQNVGRVMIEQKCGKIINMASVLGMVGHPNRAAYASSKGGIIQLTKNLAVEWAPFNITVNAVAPGPTLTAMIESQARDPQQLNKLVSKMPLGKLLSVDDVVAATLFLAGPSADMITGMTLPVDGGWVAQ